MAKQTIKLGTAPAGTDGDTTRTAFNKCNINFDELYTRVQSKLIKDIAGGAGSVSLSAAEALAGIIDLTGNITGNREVLAPADPPQTWIVRNSTTGGFAVTLRTVGGTGVTIAAGASDVVYSDGTNAVSPLAGPIAAAQAAAAAAQAAVNALLASLVAEVKYVARSTPPAGYLKANGAAVVRTTYAALFAIIGTTFGAGDGSTTFNLPDLRGEFLRGWDDGRGVDVGRVFGGWQDMQLRDHNHLTPFAMDGGAIYSIYNGAAGISPLYNTVTISGTYRAAAVGAVGGGLIGTALTGGVFSFTGSGSEIRPRNVALLACIKY